MILFTTASGAGYGLLFLVGISAAFDLGLPASPFFGFIAMVVSLGLITLGLLSSTFHLGHPERSWRAFSQWRTSWLSREGVAAVATFVPAGLMAICWVFLSQFGGFFKFMGLLSALGAIVTVYCTGMIYASLTTIRQWHNSLVVPVYLVLALATGAILFAALMQAAGAGATWHIILALGSVVAAIALKLVYWKSIDSEEHTLTTGDATGLGQFGKVRLVEAPHSQKNFVMREMGFKVARKHARKLRAMFIVAGLGLTCAMLLIALTGIGALSIIALISAIASMGYAVVVERWLFFAQAQHVVTLFYGAETA
ncbi:MAG: dimethyl sulfoxide reductase anchor subunit family protein [Hyphomicrobiales bacterium]